MTITLLRNLCFVALLASCASSSKNTTRENPEPAVIDTTVYEEPKIASDRKPLSLMDLPQSQYGGFVLAPGFYEAEFKTYCLQPGTPDPSVGDAYIQGPVTGYRKEIVESVLLNSRDHSSVDQRNVQLLLWSVVSGSNFNKLSPEVQADAARLLTPKQIFELRGGVIGVIQTVSNATGILSANKDIQRLFEFGSSSYETIERLAVLKEPSRVLRSGVKADQWYRQKENYFVRYFPLGYKRVKIQVYVPEGLLDADNKAGGDYVVFDPTGQQAYPAFTNAQRLGVGAPVIEIVRVIIQVNKELGRPRRVPDRKKPEPTNPKTPTHPKGV